MQMLRRVEDQRRVEDGEAERREDLNEEQRGRSLRSVGETACEKFHPALLCRSTRRVMSSCACDVSASLDCTTSVASTHVDAKSSRCASYTIASTRDARAPQNLRPTRPPLHSENASTQRMHCDFAQRPRLMAADNITRLPSVFSLSPDSVDLCDLCGESGLSASEHAFLFVHKKRVALIFPPLSW